MLPSIQIILGNLYLNTTCIKRPLSPSPLSGLLIQVWLYYDDQYCLINARHPNVSWGWIWNTECVICSRDQFNQRLKQNIKVKIVTAFSRTKHYQLSTTRTVSSWCFGVRNSQLAIYRKNHESGVLRNMLKHTVTKDAELTEYLIEIVSNLLRLTGSFINLF